MQIAAVAVSLFFRVVMIVCKSSICNFLSLVRVKLLKDIKSFLNGLGLPSRKWFH